jgi:putative ABC transport system permease protein
MKIADIVSLAFRTVKGNKLRTGITVAIIAFGIMALVGINTAIDAMKQKFTESFAAMGANGFTVHFKEYRIRFGDDRGGVEKEKKGARKEKKSNLNQPITREQAENFKSRFNFPSRVALGIKKPRRRCV